ARNLHVTSPMATLERGFSMTLDAQGQLVRSVNQVQVGSRLTQRLADGELDVTVAEVRVKQEL
ncbi:MAG: exodeoxyribonuclease VII large subunit, partial [Natronospirillum sp.]